ncbi:ABC transporter substrate-binding protein [Salimicrobium halophilum]|uniref:Iron complex transport system substrate-binding protein n=1 Tax=Salimicrobium halophilum TaxID=86666 RepID=A0A1G8RL59_9BACI|nr:iron-siderophore ABC transporter substrate-binding protein [Salimicrobium halophilum]SDJ17727.1 iron complex transport system substrate-binding protein [Salimicrobium halophilum]
MRKTWLFMIVALFAVVLAACGGNEDQETEEGTDENGSAEETESDSSGDTRSVTIEDATGEKTIEGTPEKVVVLEWTYAEYLQALDMQPAGVADKEGFGNWVDTGIELGEEVEDVGTRQEPNLEAISRLDPDLIVGVQFRHEGIQDQLEEIAPTVMFAPYSEESAQDQMAAMKSEFNTMGQILGKEDMVSERLDEMENHFASEQERLEEAGVQDINYVMTQAFTSQNTPTLRLFTDNSMVAKIMGNLGLENAHSSEELQIYGYTQTTVETLQNYQDAHFYYIVQEEDNIFSNQLAGNPVWEELNFVQEGRTYQMPGDTWTFGGPISAEKLATQVVDATIEGNQE